MLRENERNSSQHFWPNNVGSCYVRLHVPLQHAAERDWHGLFQNISVHNNNINNFIDLLYLRHEDFSTKTMTNETK